MNQDTSIDEEAYSFIRKRITVDKNNKRLGAVYQLTTVQRTPEGEVIEQKRIITAREYNTSYKSRDLSRHIIRQERISFLYKLQSFTIHIYENPSSDGLSILHAQVETSHGEELSVDVPPFLDIVRRLQGSADEQEYGAYSLSLIDKDALKAPSSPEKKARIL